MFHLKFPSPPGKTSNRTARYRSGMASGLQTYRPSPPARRPSPAPKVNWWGLSPLSLFQVSLVYCQPRISGQLPGWGRAQLLLVLVNPLLVGVRFDLLLTYICRLTQWFACLLSTPHHPKLKSLFILKIGRTGGQPPPAASNRRTSHTRVGKVCFNAGHGGSADWGRFYAVLYPRSSPVVLHRSPHRKP